VAKGDQIKKGQESDDDFDMGFGSEKKGKGNKPSENDLDPGLMDMGMGSEDGENLTEEQ